MKKERIILLSILSLSIISCKKSAPIEKEKEKVFAVSTISGGGTGYVDGPAIYAQYNYPAGMAIDASGNLFIADQLNNCIRKMTSNGIVSTFAGIAGTPGFIDGQGLTAQFANPFGMTIDKDDNIIVADYGNNRIRKITPSGVVSTIAGGSGGYADGIGTAAKFNGPVGVTVDVLNNIYVTDQNNNKIRKITPSGNVTTLTSTETYPMDVAVDRSGNIYYTLYQTNCIQKISTNGVVSTYAGNVRDKKITHQIQDGVASNALFCLPFGLAIDANDNLYVADTENQVIRKITPQRFVSTIGKSYEGTDVLNGKLTPARDQDGLASEAEFYYPNCITIDKQGNLYVSQGDVPINNFIKKISLVDAPGSGPTQAEMDKANWNKPTGWK